MQCNPVSERASERFTDVQHYTHAAQQQAAQRHYDRHFSRREAEVRESVSPPGGSKSRCSAHVAVRFQAGLRCNAAGRCNRL
jgi:hypothetical protein